ncbi:MAG: caspase family protein [Bauldia sp.]
MVGVRAFSASGLKVAVLLGLLALAFAVPAAAQKRVALVIGNSAYTSVGALPNPVNDARLIKTSLESAGFTVTLAESLARGAFVNTLRDFRDKADGAEWAVVYYAGHGMEVGGTNYLIPVDARLAQDRDIAFEAIPLEQVMAAIEGARGLRMVVLDACRNNPFVATMQKSGGAGRDIGRGLAIVEPTQATLVAYAAKAGTVAADGNEANSPYALALSRRLAEPGVEVSKLFRLVRDDVLEATGQRQEPFTYGSLPGRQDFYFKPPAGTSVALTTPVPPAPVTPAVPALDPRLVEAGQVWAVTRETTSIDVLKAFQSRYAGTVYADLAAARIGELQRATAPIVPATPVAPVQPAAEVAFWNSIQASNNAADFNAYLRQFPNGVYADLARNRIALLTRPATPAAPARPPRPRSPSESCAPYRTASGALDTYCVSSVLDPQAGIAYGVTNLFNADMQTAWIPDNKPRSIGEWLTVEFDGLRTVRSFSVANGYQKSVDVFSRNARVKQLRVVLSDGTSYDFTLDSKFGRQEIALPRPAAAYWVQFVIRDTYPGERFIDTAIAKLFVNSEPARP